MMKINYLILLLCLSLLVLFSCSNENVAVIPKENVTGVDDTTTEPSSTGGDPYKEIIDSYENKTVSLEDVYKIKNTFEKSVEEFGYTKYRAHFSYYDLVKLLGSTGVNTSDLTYRYEWRVDDGRYLHAVFLDVEYNNPHVPIDAIVSFLKLEPFSLDQQEIQSKYKNTSLYLYDSFYKYRYKTYAEFQSWLVYRNAPDTEKSIIEKTTEADLAKVWTEYKNVPVNRAKALNVKEGMTLYEVCVYLGSIGQSSGGGNLWVWEVNNDFYLTANILFDENSKDMLNGKVYSIVYECKDQSKTDLSQFKSLCEIIAE